MAKQFNWMWNEKQHKKWHTVRQKGRWNYIWYTGVVGWGGFMFFFLSVFPVLFGFPHPAVSTLGYWERNTLLWILAGFAFGFITWTAYEKLYSRAEVNSL